MTFGVRQAGTGAARSRGRRAGSTRAAPVAIGAPGPPLGALGDSALSNRSINARGPRSPSPSLTSSPVAETSPTPFPHANDDTNSPEMNVER